MRLKPRIRALLICSAIVCIATEQATTVLAAAEIYVSVTGSDTTGNGSSGAPYATIQKGIDTAMSGDTVVVRDGTYGTYTNANIDVSGMDFGGSNITVRSENGPAQCTIDCAGLRRAFYFHSGETTNAVLSGFTMLNGFAHDGATILCNNNSSPTLSGNVIRDGTAESAGAGICVINGSPMIENNVIASNSTPDVGGAIYGQSCASLIRNNTIYGNSTLTWLWTNEYELVVSAGAGGSVNV